MLPLLILISPPITIVGFFIFTRYKSIIFATKLPKWTRYSVPLFYVVVHLYCIYIYSGTKIPLYMLESGVIVPLCCVAPLLLFLISTFRPPDSQSSKTWPADGIIFHDGPHQREKYCVTCEHKALLWDHHCIWLNNCVGMGNYKYFYLFLATLLATLVYGSLRIWTWLFSVDGIWSLNMYRRENMLGVLMSSFMVLVAWFSWEQVSLLEQGMTLREEGRWFGVHSLVQDGLVLRFRNKLYCLDQDSVNDGSMVKLYTLDPNNGETILVRSSETEKVDVESIVNIYDKGGFWRNLEERW